MRAARWSLLVVVATLLGACSSGPVRVAAPEPPPATGPRGSLAEPAAAEAVVETPAPAAEAASAPSAPALAPAGLADAEDNPLLGVGVAGPVLAVSGPRAAARPGTVQAASAPPSGSAQPSGRIEIPAIGLNHQTYEGIDIGTINHGPSHWPGTPLPGQPGNTVFPGHRTTFSHPFYDLDKLVPGNDVIFTTASGRFTYKVTQTLIVAPTDIWVIKNTPDATFTLSACNPKGSARQRIIVKGRLAGAPQALQPVTPSPTTTPTTRPRVKFLGLL
ncbi:MAG: class E sortase [Acidimicrobiales bacterium]